MCSSDQVSFKAWFWFCLLWSLLIYSPMAKMVWGGGFLGPFGSIGAIDFAGGTVVHIASGVAALVTAAIIGPRTTYPDNTRPPHNVPFILLGAGLLWFGWFGFNGASMFAAKTAGFPFVTTSTAASAAMLTWCLIEWFKDGKPTAVGAATGAATAKGTTAAPAAAGTVDYVIQKGDTFDGIARTKLGDARKAKEIVALNPGVDPTKLKLGQTIKLPAGGETVATKTSPAAAPAASEAPVGNAYTVQKGDTLVAISRKFFGNDADWKRILDANKALLNGDAKNLREGMKIAIPAKR